MTIRSVCKLSQAINQFLVKYSNKSLMMLEKCEHMKRVH